MANKRVICVDDEQSILDLYVYHLGKAGFDVKTAENGLECGYLLHDFKPDVIVMDLKMPGFGGHKAISYLKKGPMKDIKILVVSGFITEEDTDFFNKHKIKWLNKPVDYKDLIEAIENFD